jgi:hypothetical protein
MPGCSASISEPEFFINQLSTYVASSLHVSIWIPYSTNTQVYNYESKFLTL